MPKTPPTLSLFNTLTRQVEPVRPVTEGRISLYTCGPTVYNYAHIGNLRTFLFQDLLKRTFRAAGYQVQHCMNITDVEDKIIRDSQGALAADASNEERHAAMKTLTDRFTTIFLEDLDTLGILPADHMPRATDYIPQMIRLIQDLEAKGLAHQGSPGLAAFQSTKSVAESRSYSSASTEAPDCMPSRSRWARQP